MKKIIYFTAGTTPTEQEAADIAFLNALVGQYELNVSNGAVVPNLGADVIETCDYVAGTIPTAYDAVDEFDITAPPLPPAMIATQAVVTDEQEIIIGEETFTFTVVDNEITAIVVS